MTVKHCLIYACVVALIFLLRGETLEHSFIIGCVIFSVGVYLTEMLASDERKAEKERNQ